MNLRPLLSAATLFLTAILTVDSRAWAQSSTPAELCDESNRAGLCESSPAETIAELISSSRNPSKVLYENIVAWRNLGASGERIADKINSILSAQVSRVEQTQSTKAKAGRNAVTALCERQIKNLCKNLPEATPTPAAAVPCETTECIQQAQSYLADTYSSTPYLSINVLRERISLFSRAGFMEFTRVVMIKNDGSPTTNPTEVNQFDLVFNCYEELRGSCDYLKAKDFKVYSSRFPGIDLAARYRSTLRVESLTPLDSAEALFAPEDALGVMPSLQIFLRVPVSVLVQPSQTLIGMGKKLLAATLDSTDIKIESSGGNAAAKASPGNADVKTGPCTVSPNSCPEGLRCTWGGQCRSADCVIDSDCSSGHCRVGVCVACGMDRDCGTGNQCDAGTCKPGCSTGSSCPSGTACKDGTCQPSECNHFNGPKCPAGKTCDDGECRSGCQFDFECPRGQYCDQPNCKEGCVNSFLCGEGNFCAPDHTCQPGCRWNDQCPTCTTCQNNACAPIEIAGVVAGCPPGCDTVGATTGCPNGQSCCSGNVCGSNCNSSSTPSSATPTPEATTEPSSSNSSISSGSSSSATSGSTSSSVSSSSSFSATPGCGTGDCRSCADLDEAAACCEFNNGADCTEDYICGRIGFQGCPFASSSSIGPD